MKTSIRGSLAAAALCALLAACGGSDSPTVLPASVAITNDARVETGSAETFATDLSVTGGLTFRWDFGDGTTGAGASVSHTYAKPGQYQVTLAVANTAQDLRTSSSSIQVGAYSNVSGLNCTQPNSSGWCWQHAIATGHAINDVFFVDATHAWAVGDALTLLKSSDGGGSWTPVTLASTLATASLRSVRFYDAMHGMVLNDQGAALQTSDGGATWKLNGLGGLVYGNAATFVDYGAARIIVASYANGAMSLDGGVTWTLVGVGGGNGQVQATTTDCWSFNSSSAQRAAGCGATATMALLPSSGGLGYQYLGSGAFASATQGLVVGYGYAYNTSTWSALGWATADGGASWTGFQVNGLPTYYGYGTALHMSDAARGTFYSPGDLSAYSTLDGGHNWTAVTPATLLSQAYSGYRATGFTAGGTLWQSSTNNVATSADLGRTWQTATVHEEDAAVQSGTITSFMVTQYTDASHFVVATNNRFHATQDGQTFKRILGGDGRDANLGSSAGAFVDTKHGTFVTSRGAILSTADGGRTWTRADYPTNSGQPIALHFSSATEGWLVLNGTLEHSTDGGATWSTPLTGSAMSNLLGMSWGDATHAWVWTYGKLFATADGGKTWAAVKLPSAVYATTAVMTGPLAGVVSSGYGNPQTTQDGGATWQASAGVSPYGNLVHGAGQAVWSLSYSPSRSKDGGATWQATNLANYGSTITGLAFADDLHGWMITSGGTVLHTIDGGDTWAGQSVGADLQLEGIVAVDPMTAWIITSNGQILATATSGN